MEDPADTGGMRAIAALHLAQADGGRPAALAAGGAPGESGVSVFRLQFRDGMHFSAVPQHHLVCFHLSRPARYDCRIAGAVLSHDAPVGTIAICPAGADSAAEAGSSVDTLLVTADPSRLALAAATEPAGEAQLIERLSGQDPHLLALAGSLAEESAAGYPNGPLFWNETASRFIDGLLTRHTAAPLRVSRGRLGREALARITDHVRAHLDQPIAVATLAAIAGRSPFHFVRVFSRSVGVTPHRYVVHLRLQRAIELVRAGGASLAEIAARTGFADQSHLSRWVRRVHGVSLTGLDA